MVLLQVPDLSSEVSALVVGSFSTQPITLEIMRIPTIEHVFIMPGEFRGRSSSVNRIALASTLSLRSMETIGCGSRLIAAASSRRYRARCVKVVIAEGQRLPGSARVIIEGAPPPDRHGTAMVLVNFEKRGILRRLILAGRGDAREFVPADGIDA